jgi:hypothetical protein
MKSSRLTKVRIAFMVFALTVILSASANAQSSGKYYPLCRQNRGRAG